MENEVEYRNPILIVENMTNESEFEENLGKNNGHKISQSEDILLTLIAEIIVEIILKEEI
ncbi:hypothetical protein [Pedobacter westerhofensis]|nr:hypothetical protein [Pedobacter westerhofensis]